jgi:predicted AlkP superfamily phosphohydrolase/phosphomutase
MILVLALDALDPDLVERFRGEGHLPTLSGLAEGGWAGRLRSTWPPVSVPAWSTFLTGVGPGRHGLFDFTRLQGTRIRFQTGADRAVPTLLEIADAAGRRVCSIGVPTTYPVPNLRHGAVLAGFDSPFTGAPDARSLVPVGLWRRIGRGGVDLRPATVPEGHKGSRWHRSAARGILESIDRRLDQALAILAEGPWDLLVVHFQAADTAGHHFFRYFDASSPRYDASHPERSRVLPAVYDALDRAASKLIEACGDDSDVVVVSDHGMGPAGDHVCYINRWLEEQSLLSRRDPRGDWAGMLRSMAIRRVPRALQARLFRLLSRGPAATLESTARLGSLDLDRSVAFSEESSTLPGVWLIDPRRRDEIIERLRGWEAVVRVYRREDLYRGPLRGRAPDLLLELRHSPVRTPPGYAGPSVRRLSPHELDGERGAALNGVHRPEGLVLAKGSGFPGAGALEGAWIGDLSPTLLTHVRVPVPAWMEGRPLRCLDREPLWEETIPSAPSATDGARMSRSDEARLERRLRALGYLG